MKAKAAAMVAGAVALVLWAILKGCPMVIDSLWGTT
jgi:hypothetical protein